MKHVLFVTGLFVASPVFGQSRVYTNADLRKPMLQSSPITAVEAAAILAPNQFVYVPTRRAAPVAMVLPSSATAGPFGEFSPPSPMRRLDGSLYTDRQWRVTHRIGRRRDALRVDGTQYFRRATSPFARRTPAG